MVNLRVYDQSGSPYYIDLYETEPLKLNFSIEDITSTDAKSTFSRVFRVPSTLKNNEFFAMAFLIEGIDYDVTVKVPAEIEVGGAFFRAGHIRLQNIYRNEEQGRIDYELLFLGETRDFSSLIGEKRLCDLDGNAAGYTHILNYANVVQSWNAFPQSTSGTAGLYSGDILYPLADHGNTYNGSGVAQESEIKTVGSSRFTQNSHPLEPERFKPMIRAKSIIDMIFAQTPYTYTSSFLTGTFFKKIYVSAWGNDASIEAQTNQTEQLMQVTFPGIYSWTGVTNMQIPCYNEVYDPGNNYSPNPFPLPAFAYTCPLTGVYDFTASGYINAVPDPFTGPAGGLVEIWVNGVVAASGPFASSGISDVTLSTTLSAGDYVQMFTQWSANTNFGSYIEDATFTCTGAPGLLDPTFLLDCEYKQIDFLRDILKVFRCVMAPDKDNPNNFIIEPWISYVTTGETYDWSEKVDRTKDFQIEPLFYTQTDEIQFLFSEDEDWLNKYNQDAYKQVYGQLIFDSGNELLADTRDITVGFAPTPTIQVEGEAPTSTWIIPQPHTHDSEGGATVHLPIKPVTRLLFYNGLKATPATWYFNNGGVSTAWNQYPQVSYQEAPNPLVPPSSNGLNLNWDKWFAYYGTQVPNFNQYAGQSLFERYWSGYIGSLYNKYARRVTCHVILNSVDLQNFSFDDIIFIDGVYYIPEKIIDAPIGEKASVKVQLIKLLDYRPGEDEEPQTWYYYNIAQTDCLSVSSTVYVLKSAVQLDPGDWIGVQTSTDCYTVLGPSASTAFDYIFEEEYGDCPSCQSQIPTNVYYVQQYGEVCPITIAPSVTVSSTGPHTVGDTVTLTTLAGCWRIMGPSSLVPTDTIAATSPDCVTCTGTAGPYYYNIQNCADPNDVRIVNSPGPIGNAPISITIAEAQGCYIMIGPSAGPPNCTWVATYTDCDTCAAQNPETELYYDLQNCQTAAFTVGAYPYPLTPGMAVQVDALPGCWEVISATVGPPLVNILTTFPDCQVCDNNPPVE